MTTTLVILCLSAILFVSGRIRSDLIAVCTALSLVLLGVLTPEEALSGFSNPIVIMMAGLFVVGGGIFSTGLAQMAGERILSLAGKSDTRLLVLLMLATSAVGAFVSNTGTVALMLPIVVGIARAAGLHAARFLMPLAFAGSMGGMLTLIGTPPNLVVRDALETAGYEAPGFFSFTPIGVICITVGIVVLLPLSKRFLRGGVKEDGKRRRTKSPEELIEEYGVAERIALLRVPGGNAVIGQSVKALGVRERFGVTVVELRRVQRRQGSLLRRVEQYAAADVPLAAGDMLCVSGSEAHVADFATALGLKRAEEAKGRRALRFYELGVSELLVLPTSKQVNRTIEEAGFRKRFGLNVLGVRRHGSYLIKNIRKIQLHAADVVLVQGPWDNIERLRAESDDYVPLSGDPAGAAATRPALDYKAPLAALIMLAMVATMAFDFIPFAPVTAVMLAAVSMIFTGCLRNVEEAYKTINWESIILFAAMLPMSIALEKTGASALISSGIVASCGDLGPYALLAAIYLATSLLTFFISNTVTAVLMAPIALAAAGEQGISAVPLLMGVTVAASMCFASAFSTPPNVLVMSAGGYRPIDYVRVGLPLQLIMALVMVIALPLLFPF